MKIWTYTIAHPTARRKQRDELLAFQFIQSSSPIIGERDDEFDTIFSRSADHIVEPLETLRSFVDDPIGWIPNLFKLYRLINILRYPTNDPESSYLIISQTRLLSSNKLWPIDGVEAL